MRYLELYQTLKKYHSLKELLSKIKQNFERVVEENKNLIEVRIGTTYDNCFIFYFMDKVIRCRIDIDFKSSNGILKFENVNDDGKSETIFSVFVDENGNVFKDKNMKDYVWNLFHSDYYEESVLSIFVEITNYIKKIKENENS